MDVLKEIYRDLNKQEMIRDEQIQMLIEEEEEKEQKKLERENKKKERLKFEDIFEIDTKKNIKLINKNNNKKQKINKKQKDKEHLEYLESKKVIEI